MVALSLPPRYEPTAAGIKIEKKEEIIKRINRSPDIAEAVMLANLPNSVKKILMGAV